MKKQLCRPCAEALKEKRSIALLEAPKDHKDTCAKCGRRRFTSLYEVRLCGNA